MTPSTPAPKRKVVFFFTSFPVLSETFLEREMEAIAESGLSFQIVVLWRGAKHWKGYPVVCGGLFGALAGILWLPYWLLRKPQVIGQFLRWIWRPRKSGWLNFGENLLGLGYALGTARKWEKDPDLSATHAVWGSAPAMAALGFHRLIGLPYSFGAHAYDLFERGGDGWLPEKMESADWIRTSTQVGVDRLIELGARKERIHLIRRGLFTIPPFEPFWAPSKPWKILSVGRMVEKMGFARQCLLFEALTKAKIDFSVTWIGDGPERSQLERLVSDLGLESSIHFLGAQPYSEVEKAYASHDIFLFTGQKDRRGDRAGLPNAIGEAMAWGLPVFATSVGAVEEAILDGETGVIWRRADSADEFLSFLENEKQLAAMRLNARKWVMGNFIVKNNLGPFLACFE